MSNKVRKKLDATTRSEAWKVTMISMSHDTQTEIDKIVDDTRMFWVLELTVMNELRKNIN